MATYDLLMLAILVGLTLYGYYKGMAWQIAYIASFVASGVLAFRFADKLAPQVTFVNPPLNKFVAIAIIYAVASFGVWLLFRIVRGGIDKVKMDGFDHQMGAILGFGRGVLWCVGVTFLTLTVLPLPQAQKQQVVASKSGYYIARLLDETDSLFPPEVHQVIGPYLDRLENELEGSQPPAGGGLSWPSANPGGAAPATPAWGQSAAPATTPTPSWPSAPPSTQPAAASGWPQANTSAPPAAPSQPAASDFGWPSAGSQTPAQPASWPEWGN